MQPTYSSIVRHLSPKQREPQVSDPVRPDSEATFQKPTFAWRERQTQREKDIARIDARGNPAEVRLDLLESRFNAKIT